jgi:hypothetical protein
MTARMAHWLAPGFIISVLLWSAQVLALPGFFVGKNASKRVSHADYIVVMNKDQESVVSVMTDYEGPFEPFALVLAVPGDVTVDHIETRPRRPDFSPSIS